MAEKRYPELAAELLPRARRRAVTTLEKIAFKPLPPEAAVLEFTVYWNGYFPASVSVYPRDAAGNEVSDRRPYGELFELNPPVGDTQPAPQTVAADYPVVLQLLVEALAEWWQESGGTTRFPAPVRACVDGVALRAYDLRRREWVTDALGARRAGATQELVELLRPRLDVLRERAVEKLRKVATPSVLAEATQAYFEVFLEGWELDVACQLADASGGVLAGTNLFATPRRPMVRVPDLDGSGWEEFVEAGADAQAALKTALERLMADVWRDAGGADHPQVRAVLSYHDDGAEFDLVQRHWVTDFLGRPLAG
jgi:hypothetical protein